MSGCPLCVYFEANSLVQDQCGTYVQNILIPFIEATLRTLRPLQEPSRKSTCSEPAQSSDHLSIDQVVPSPPTSVPDGDPESPAVIASTPPAVRRVEEPEPPSVEVIDEPPVLEVVVEEVRDLSKLKPSGSNTTWALLCRRLCDQSRLRAAIHLDSTRAYRRSDGSSLQLSDQLLQRLPGQTILIQDHTSKTRATNSKVYVLHIRSFSCCPSPPKTSQEAPRPMQFPGRAMLSSPPRKRARGGGVAYHEVQRNRAARALMQPADCACCREWHKDLTQAMPTGGPCAPGDHLKDQSRHRFNQLPMGTPRGYWDVAFPPTQAPPPKLSADLESEPPS